MKSFLTIVLLSSALAVAEEPKRSGKATAQWIVPDGAVEPGMSFKTVIRLQVDEPWHVYWLNPGEAGMATSAEIKLPEGWRSSGLRHPIPKRFQTGGLHGFGHEDAVDYAVELFAPNDFKGDAEFEAKVEWLTCNNDACIPGEMTLKLTLEDGKPVNAAIDPAAVAIAFDKLPTRAAPKVEMKFEDEGKHWKISLKNFDAYKMDPAKTEVFVATLELVTPRADVRFSKVDGLWVAKFPKGEFTPQRPDECAILLVEKGKRAVRVEWKREQ